MQHIVVLSIDSGDPSLTDFHHGLLSPHMDAAYRKNPIHRGRIYEASTKLFGLCDELGLVNRWSQGLWRKMRILPEAGPRIPAATQ